MSSVLCTEWFAIRSYAPSAPASSAFRLVQENHQEEPNYHLVSQYPHGLPVQRTPRQRIRMVGTFRSPQPLSSLSNFFSSFSYFRSIDTDTELSSCGGCASTGQGQDCSDIPFSWNVGCQGGACTGSFFLSSSPAIGDRHLSALLTAIVFSTIQSTRANRDIPPRRIGRRVSPSRYK